MPGGAMKPHPPEVWNKAKELYLQGLQWSKVAEAIKEAFGIALTVPQLKDKASSHGWTAVRAEVKAKQELNGLRPLLHNKLLDTAKQIKVPKTGNSARLKATSELILVQTQAAKILEGWQDHQSNTLVNIAVLSSAVTEEPGPVLDCTVPEEKACLDVVPEQPSEG